MKYSIQYFISHARILRIYCSIFIDKIYLTKRFYSYENQQQKIKKLKYYLNNTNTFYNGIFLTILWSVSKNVIIITL